MIDVRPTVGPNYLVRPRLLGVLPASRGHVVWLEAPYGYGKSVLAAQWALQLETAGWRIVWLSVAGRPSVRAALAQARGLPNTAPWGPILDELWSERTVVVLEELEGAEELEPLLNAPAGLLLLASRQHLPYPGLLRLITSNHLTHLNANQLAFTKDEAAAIFGERAGARRAWEATNGWPLPLHFAALSGELPANTTLIKGVKRSISFAAWRELLLLAAVPELPHSAATDVTASLAQEGFAQKLTGAYRLHPLIGQGLLEAYRDDVRAELLTSAKRLPPDLRGAAFERAQDYDALAAFISGPDGELGPLDAADYLRWHTLTSGETTRTSGFAANADRVDGSTRQFRAAEAAFLLTHFSDAIPAAKRLVEHQGATVAARARLARTAIWSLAAANRFAEAHEFAPVLKSLLADLEPLQAAESLSVLGQLAYWEGNMAKAEATYKRCLDEYAKAPPSSAREGGRARVTANFHALSWEAHGYVREPLAGLLELAEAEGLPQGVRLLARQNAAVHFANLNDYSAAAEQIRLVLAGAPGFSKLYMELILAYVEPNLSEFPRLLNAARKWERYSLTDRVSALWLRALRRQGDLVSGLRLRNTLEEGAFTKLELVWVYAHANDLQTAAALLEEARDAHFLREFKVHWLAASYRLDPSEETLNELLELTAIGAQALVYALIPVALLPRNRPELARPYPLSEVLESGWREAIELRIDELPPLRVELLGCMRVVVLGREVELTQRQEQLVALLAIGHSREEAAEFIWPEVDTDHQRNNLNVQLNLLRKRLEPWGVGVYLDKAGLRNFTSDYAEFLDALARRDAEAASSLFAVPLSPPAAGGARLDVLADVERQLREQLSELLLSESQSGGEPAVTYLKRILALEPLHEEALRKLVETLLELGREGEARRQYDKFAARLFAEVGELPQQATQAVVAGAET